MKKKIFFTLLGLVFLTGICLVIYPIISNALNSLTNESKINKYNTTVNTFSSYEKEQLVQQANEYNEYLSSDYFSSELTEKYKELSKSYDNILNFGNGLICYVNIPEVNVKLPVYHSSVKDVLTKGAAHLKHSSFPIGGNNTHSVISAHSGYPTQKFFDDLDELKIGDVFYITILDKTLKYKVSEISIVEPDDSDKLKIVKGKDMVTLSTCYPFSVNTHRLLVTGERVNIGIKENVKKTEVFETDKNLNMWCFSLFIILCFIYTIILIKSLKIRR